MEYLVKSLLPNGEVKERLVQGDFSKVIEAIGKIPKEETYLKYSSLGNTTTPILSERDASIV